MNRVCNNQFERARYVCVNVHELLRQSLHSCNIYEHMLEGIGLANTMTSDLLRMLYSSNEQRLRSEHLQMILEEGFV
jgi:hypothetical protein